MSYIWSKISKHKKEENTSHNQEKSINRNRHRDGIDDRVSEWDTKYTAAQEGEGKHQYDQERIGRCKMKLPEMKWYAVILQDQNILH